MAGAGTGKTHTLIARCLDCLCREQVSLDEILVVTFTEAAATEMRQRLRQALETSLVTCHALLVTHLSAQLALFDAAHIGTLHSFCLKLVREHFYALGLDPQPAVLDEGEARLLAGETLEDELQIHYAGAEALAEAVQKLIQIYGGGRDEKIRSLVLRLHHYAQTRPDAEGWLAQQLENFSQPEPDEWRTWLLDAIRDWYDEWLPLLEGLKSENEKAEELAGMLSRLGSVPAPETVRCAPAPNTDTTEQTGGRQVALLTANDEGVVGGTRGACAPPLTRKTAAAVLEQVVSADGYWPAKRKTILREPLKDLFDEAKFLVSLAAVKNGKDPLVEDWDWIRGHMTALLRLTQNFSARFAARKRDDGVLDFHDLEQFALKLLWDFAADKPTPVAERWREKMRFVFVDEYQDINAAQDKIIQALSRGRFGVPPSGGKRHRPSEDGTPNAGNRFLVGDVKQSIYRFRLADPKIFRDYAAAWQGKSGQTIPLSENFRSREGLLHLVNSIFGPLLRREIGGVPYDAEAQLQFGSPKTRGALSLAGNPTPRAELLWRLKPTDDAGSENDAGPDDPADLEEAAKEARLLALRLQELKDARHEIWSEEQQSFRPAEWRDMTVLLRSPANKAEVYAKEFERAGVPLMVERGGFYDSAEILDLMSLLQLLDNPLQDVPCIAVLRSPLVGMSLAELAEIRLAAKDVHFWTALNQIKNSKLKIKKAEKFLERFSRWRKMARQWSLSQCLEEILAETHYAEWLGTRPRGARRQANVEQFLNLARRFDQFQRQGLFRFLKFIDAQRDAGVEPEVAAAAKEDAVRLMSIHQSKGLEFPVVAVADLGKPFNTQDLRAEIILDETFGLCPRVRPPQAGGRYPSLPHWLAQRHERRELWGEELRLLYVALTRARDTLILSGGITPKKWGELWEKPATVTSQQILAAKSCADWLGLWFSVQSSKSKAQNGTEGELPNLRWRIVDDEKLSERWGERLSRRSQAKADAREPETPPHPSPALDNATLKRLRALLSWEYPFTAATRHAAKSSVTALRRQAAEEPDDEAEQVFQPDFSPKRLARTLAPPDQKQRAKDYTPKLSAAETGSAHHKFLQHLALEKANELAALKAEAIRLTREKAMSSGEAAALDLEAIAAFWNSPPGKKICAQAAQVRRELAFTAKFSPQELAEIIGAKPAPALENEFVVVQGIADLVVLLPKEIWLLDFKTDEIRAGELPAKIKNYTPQLKLYALALSRIYSRPVTNCWLHFLSQKHSAAID